MYTADLCDAHDDVRVLEPRFRDYGKRSSFHGRVRTLHVKDDNALVRAQLELPGNGDVLVVDGEGSERCALVGGKLGELAATNGWSGIVVHGCVRDAHELAACDVGVKALGVFPRKSGKKGAGNEAVTVSFAGVTIAPGDWLYADADGILVSARPLHAGEDE